MPSPELQSPFSCTWKPCSAPGFNPETLVRLAHVVLAVLDRLVLGGGLRGLPLLGGDRVLGLLVLRGGLGLLVGRRRRRDLGPGGGAGEHQDEHANRGLHARHGQSPVAGCAPAATIFSGRLPCFTSSCQSTWCSRAHSSST